MINIRPRFLILTRGQVFADQSGISRPQLDNLDRRVSCVCIAMQAADNEHSCVVKLASKVLENCPDELEQNFRVAEMKGAEKLLYEELYGKETLSLCRGFVSI